MVVVYLVKISGESEIKGHGAFDLRWTDPK